MEMNFDVFSVKRLLMCYVLLVLLGKKNLKICLVINWYINVLKLKIMFEIESVYKIFVENE